MSNRSAVTHRPAIDVGNTRIKLGLFACPTSRSRGELPTCVERISLQAHESIPWELLGRWQSSEHELHPAVIAGSIFTFSLSLGDYITVQIVGGKNQMLGNVVYQNFSLNLPFAAAVSMIPIAIMVVYLSGIRRTGALENL